jgi:hypothetical protein
MASFMAFLLAGEVMMKAKKEAKSQRRAWVDGLFDTSVHPETQERFGCTESWAAG